MNSLCISLNAKYGLHAFNLGKLPTLSEYQKLQDLQEKGVLQLFAFTLENEFELLAKNATAELCLSFPTLGFTDPAMDYSLAPQFAIPVMINGLVSKETTAFRAKLVVTDIGGTDYPLCISNEGTIDFELIEKSIPDKQHLFTTLDKITFIYTKDQLVPNENLTYISNPISNTIEILAPQNIENFNIQVKVVCNNQVLCERIIDYHMSKNDKYDGKLQAIWQQGREKSYLHVNYKIITPKNHHACFRAKVTVDIPLQEGVQYTWESAPFTKGEETKALRFSQYHGISHHFFKKILASLISQAHFEADLLLKSEALHSSFNRYDIYPQLKTVLYDRLLEGVLNRTVPLFSLSPYFAHFKEAQQNLSQIVLDSYDTHDQVVFHKLYQLLEQEQAIMPLLEEVDKILSHWEAFTEISIVLETMGKALNANTFHIKANVELEDIHGQVIYQAKHNALLQVLKKHRQLSLVENKQLKTNKKEIFPNIINVHREVKKS
ncbi:MAG: hypothetical protein JSR17_07480 [Proteobacteria bacterium]|nr:hypothetical protein [Pseudomonadota bacterium]